MTDPEGRVGSAPERLGPCRLLRRLGVGGTGTVYEAEMCEDRPYAAVGTRVALKVVHPHIAADVEAFHRFGRELAVGSALDHPGVVRTYEAGVAVVGGARSHFLVLQFVAGQTLAAIMAELGTVPEPLVRDLGRRAALGLAAIHAAGAVHRDLKPANIVVTPDAEVKLIDLGTARLHADQTVTRAGHFVGTLLYAAPERLRGGPVRASSDLYALGVVLYEAATGVQPFASEDIQVVLRRQLDEIPTRAAKINPLVSPFLDRLLASLLDKDPERRPGSAADLAGILELGESSRWWHDVELSLLYSQSRGRLHRIRVGRGTRLVGRDRDLDRLTGLYSEVRAGKGRVVWLEGEAGVGKTRLVDGLLASLEEAGAELHFLYGSYAPGDSGSTRGALADAVVGHFGLPALEASLRRHLVAAPSLAPVFAAFLGSSGDPSATHPMASAGVRDALYCQLAKSLAAERPVVWVVEDLHFAGRVGWDLLLSLARIAQDRRLLLIATSRGGAMAEGVAALGRLGVLRRLTLARLDLGEVGELLSQSLAGAELGRHAAEVARRSDGNPLFALALARELRASAGVGTGAATASTDAPVPSSIRDHLLATLGAADEGERALLDLASVHGFEFDPDLLSRALGRPRLAVLQALASLERRTGLVRSTGAGFEHSHHLLQELLYSEQPPLLRAEHHAMLASARERELGVHGDEMCGEDVAFLATHYLRAGRMGDARRFLARAVEHLAVQERGEAVIALATESIGQLGAEDGGLICDLRLAQAERLHTLGRRGEELAAVEAALAQARAIADGAREGRCLLALGTYLRSLGKLAEARQVMESALEVVGDPRSEARASLLLGMLLLALTEFDRSLELLTHSARLFRELEDWIGEGDALRNLGRHAVLLSRYDDARMHFEGSLACYRRSGHRSGEGLVQGANGLMLSLLGEQTEADATFREHLRLTRETGHRVAEANALHYLGDSACNRGRLEEARDLFNQSVTLARETGERQVEMAATQGLGRMWMYWGRLDRARDVLARNLAALRAIDERRWEASALTDVGLLSLSEGHVERAWEELEESRRMAAVRGLRGQEIRAVRELAVAAHALGRLDEARDLHTQSLAESDRFGEAGSAALSALGLGRALLASGEVAAAVGYLRRAERFALQEERGYLGNLPTAYLALAGEVEAAGVTPARAVWADVQIETELALAGAGLTHRLVDARRRLERIGSYLSPTEREQFWRGNPLCRWLGQIDAAPPPMSPG